MMRPVILVDSMNFFFLRQYMANPQMDKNGNPIGGTIGFLKSLGSLIKKLYPEKVYVIWETGGSPRRLKIYPEYKQRSRPMRTNRVYDDAIPDTKDNEIAQKQLLINLLQYLPVTQIHVDNCEADDIIAYISKSIFQDKEKIIVSSDKDFYQLLNDKTSLWNPGKKKYVREKDVIEEYNITPDNFAVAKAFNGDPSDNIPGVDRVGFKTLSKRIVLNEEKVTVEDILSEAKRHILEDKKPLVMWKNIVDSEDMILRNMQLMNLDDKLLSVGQVQDINRIVKEFKPQYNKIKFWKTYLDLELDGLDVENLCNCFHFLIHSA
jgi:5'-3' exonuclease